MEIICFRHRATQKRSIGEFLAKLATVTERLRISETVAARYCTVNVERKI